MKKQNKIIVLLLAIVLSFTGIALFLTPNQANASTTDTSIDNICKTYTDTENPNGINVDTYVQDFLSTIKVKKADTVSLFFPRNIAKGTYFQNGCSYSGGTSMDYTINISADDNIVKIVPKELFKNEGQKLYIGRKYGFYITTRKAKKYDFVYSTVVLFGTTPDISTNNDYIFSLQITTLMEMDYCYVDKDTDKTYTKNNQNIIDGQWGDIVFENENISDAVIPMIREYWYLDGGNLKHYCFYFDESNDLYVNDISFGANIYNANSLNCGDPGYNIDNDYGYFFIGNEYEFSASKKKNNGDWVQGTKKLGKAVASYILGRIIRNDFLAQQVVSYIDNAFTASDIVKTYVGEELVYNETNKNYVYPNSHLYNTRDSQKQAYGGLAKTSAIMINTTGDDRLYFYNGDYAKGTFSFSHTDKPNGKEYSQLNACVGMRICDKGTWSAQISNNIIFDISPQETHTLNVMQEHGYYMLPNGTMKFAVNPEFGGEYVFDVAKMMWNCFWTV